MNGLEWIATFKLLHFCFQNASEQNEFFLSRIRYDFSSQCSRIILKLSEGIIAQFQSPKKVKIVVNFKEQ